MRHIEIGFPDTAELKSLLNAYFDGPHNFYFYAFIHRPTFQQKLDRGAIPDYLLYIVLATGLHFLEPKDKRADIWADKSRTLIMLDIFSPPSTTTLQGLLLLQRYEWHRASHMNAWMLSGLALRIAQGLQLNFEVPDESRTTITVRETRRRLMWSCLIMESMIESGRNPLSKLDLSSIEVRLPCNENSFQLALESHMGGLNEFGTESYVNDSHTTSRPGISAFIVKLGVLRREILNYTLPYHPRNRGKTPSHAPWETKSPFWSHEQKLKEWEACLSPELQFKDEVLYRRQPQLYNFITLHCLFHGCWCDLNRIGSYMTALSQTDNVPSLFLQCPPSFMTNCHQNRLRHGLSICKVITDSATLHGLDHDPVVAISASLAIRILTIERRVQDSLALGMTEEEIHSVLNAPIQCVKRVAERSKPIFELFQSICTLARRNGYVLDMEDGNTSNQTKQEQEPRRATSPSLRTFGTFGKIQNDMASRGDEFAPAACSPADEDSDVFNYVRRDQAGNGPDASFTQISPNPTPPHSIFPSYEMIQPSALEMGHGWGDGTLNFSMSPVQLGWINQSLDVDFDLSGFI